MTTGQHLVKLRVISPVQFVDWHLPDGVGPTGAVAGVAVALVGHSANEKQAN